MGKPPFFAFGFSAVALLLFALAALAPSAARATETCFDFNNGPVKVPLREPMLLDRSKDVTDGAKLADKHVWGAARGVVAKPIQEIYKLLLDPRTIIDTRSTQVDETEEKRKGFLDFHQLKLTIKPFPFVSASWIEEWGFALAEGTPAAPKEIVISYQKTTGTEHLRKLCGSIVLRRLSARATDVYLYEELAAPGRTLDDTIKGHLGTLATLRR